MSGSIGDMGLLRLSAKLQGCSQGLKALVICGVYGTTEVVP
jgi:hypothetical protein